MQINITTLGQGPAFGFIHGFGFNHHCFDSLVKKMSDHYQCFLIDLPGFGKSDYQPYTLDLLIKQIAEALPSSMHLLGWSLGGLVALAYADKYPKRVKSLILISSNPLFIAKNNWPGMDPKAFHFFLKQCKRDINSALTLFLTLQKACNAKVCLKALDAPQMSIDENVTTMAAMNALMILAQSDLRQAYNTISMPLLSVFGALDQLVPVALSQALKYYGVNKQRIEIFDNSAHAPFFEEEAHFIHIMDDFLCKIY